MYKILVFFISIKIIKMVIIMKVNLGSKSIVAKMLQVGFSSFLSKILGIVREILQIRYFGKPGAMSDAFAVAFRIPNILRKVFAEGALSAALIPNLVQLNKDDESQLHKLVTLVAISLTAVVLLLCIIVVIWARPVVLFAAPGYVHKPLELSIAVPLLRILIFFVLFISSAALFTGAMQAKQHFFIPSWGPIILNIAYITGLVICTSYTLPIGYLAFFLLFGGFFQAAIFLYAYMHLKLKFSMPDRQTWYNFRHFIVKFIPCILAVGASEINLFIDTQFASTLPSGHYTLLSLAYRFMAIALSVFAVSFSSILLPYFSKISGQAKNRLGYYLLEASKLVLWVTLPVILFMLLFADDIFYTIFYRCSSKFTLENVEQGALLLRGFVWALSFFSINKIFLSVFYSRHSTLYPTFVALFGALSNAFLNWMLVPEFGALGLAIGTSFSEFLQCIVFILGIVYLLKVPFFGFRIFEFFKPLVIQVSFFAALFFILYYFGTLVFNYSQRCSDLILHHIGLWLWVGPLFLILFFMMYKTRRYFKIKIYYLD